MDYKKKTFTRPEGWEKDIENRKTHFLNLEEKKKQEELAKLEKEKKQKVQQSRFSGLMKTLFGE